MRVGMGAVTDGSVADRLMRIGPRRS